MKGPLRIIFPLTVLLLWAMFGMGLANGTWTPVQWLMLILGHLACLIIFVSFIYVFNYGYGLALALIGTALLALMPSAQAALIGGIAIAFGLRILRFTYTRYRAGSYSGHVERQQQANTTTPLPVKLVVWIFVSWLMAFELMPLYFVARSTDGEPWAPWATAGGLLMLLGLVAEAIADNQKQAAKERNPSGFVTAGLFRLVRHPNYLGEIVFQLGLIVACLGSVSGWREILLAVPAPIYVIILMSYAALDGDRQQASRYGDDPAYQQYRSATGRLLPGL